MTIVRVQDVKGLDKVIKAGQYVLFESMMTHGICTKPYEVFSVSGSRVTYFDHPDDKDTGSTVYKSTKSIVFFTDTKDEADALRKLSQSKLGAVDTAIAAVYADFNNRVEDLIKGSQV
jgi:hypothetical protein